MNVADERTKSCWMEFPLPRRRALHGNMEADAVVIGSGIAGLSVAYELAARGRSVIVLDRGGIGSGMTARTTAHLASALDDFYSELIKSRDQSTARLLHESLAASIDRAEQICATEGFDCDFARLDGYLFLAPDTPREDLHSEFETCRGLGVAVVEQRGIPLGGMSNVPALRFARQARFHPLKYLAGLQEAILGRGGSLYANTCVTSVEELDGTVLVKTSEGHEVRARDAIVATNSPINDHVAVHTKQAPYRTYVVSGTIPHGSLADALYWDTLEAYHYVRLQPWSDRDDLIIVGGEDHKSGKADDGEERFGRLEQWARARIPQLKEITHRWSGQVLEPVDHCGFIGKNPGNDHVYMVSGDSGQGITNGIVGGMVIADLIATGANPWSEVYNPSRKVAGSLGEYLTENLGVAKNFAEYVTPGDIDSLEKLKPGEGGLYRKGLHKVAACRDANGVLHTRSASCTHMGCVVHWNSLEQCWDCPCHGSQFAPDGTALNGPAVTALADESKLAVEAG
ncbi:MAG: FAD-dependent oxidoreductase [Alphaproteobacteria bacterium]|nr:FAD-dependent oxidoreductase [Alphaproteobacteria bacterium]